ncbi:MAG: hypothetical protein WD894_05020 [Pirellulales bacterium]
MIILLDLNYTLVGNSRETFIGFQPDIEREQYRLPLIGLLQQHHVALVTHRGKEHEAATLQGLRDKAHWCPAEWHFNDRGWTAPRWKEFVLVERIWKVHGQVAQILAIESNLKTAEMYERHGLMVLKVVRDGSGNRADVAELAHQKTPPKKEAGLFIK